MLSRAGGSFAKARRQFSALLRSRARALAGRRDQQAVAGASSDMSRRALQASGFLEAKPTCSLTRVLVPSSSSRVAVVPDQGSGSADRHSHPRWLASARWIWRSPARKGQGAVARVPPGATAAAYWQPAGANNVGRWSTALELASAEGLVTPPDDLRVLARHRLLRLPGGFEGICLALEKLGANDLRVPETETPWVSNSTSAPVCFPTPRWRMITTTLSPASIASSISIRKSSQLRRQASFAASIADSPCEIRESMTGRIITTRGSYAARAASRSPLVHAPSIRTTTSTFS